MRNSFLNLVLIILISVPVLGKSALAAPASGTGISGTACTGPVTVLQMTVNGTVITSVGGLSNVSICGVNSVLNNISVDACKAMYGMLLASRTSQTPVSILLNDSSTCASHSWSMLNMWSGPIM